MCLGIFVLGGRGDGVLRYVIVLEQARFVTGFRMAAMALMEIAMVDCGGLGSSQLIVEQTR